MDKSPREFVVYLLGAGFSAPLGLPTIANFLEKAKDQFSTGPKEFKHFEGVFKEIKRLASAKASYNVNLHNIEDIMSLLQMEGELNGTHDLKLVGKFICDVIRHHTPGFERDGDLVRSGWHNQLFAIGPVQQLYLHFVAGLFGLRVVGSLGNAGKKWPPQLEPRVEARRCTYGVISLNYDCVLEESLSALLRGVTHNVRFAKTEQDWIEGGDAVVPLAKLHGSVDTGAVVPPTWSKSLSEPVREDWRLALRMLAKATQVRVLGYSLPEADKYLRYLLQVGGLESFNLKRFDVLDLNLSPDVQARYEALVSLPNRRYCKLDVSSYLHKVKFENRPQPHSDPLLVECDLNERAHEQAFEGR